MNTPKLDNRDAKKIMEQLQALVPLYTPEWKPANGDSGEALLQIFSQMYAGILERLNRLPDKHFSAYLDMLGIRLLLPSASRAPVSVKLSDDALESVMIPEGTQLTAASSAPQPLIFETETQMWATPAKLAMAYSVVPDANRIYQTLEPLIKGESISALQGRLGTRAKQGDSVLYMENVEGFMVDDIVLLGETEFAEIQEIKEYGLVLTKNLEQCHELYTTIHRVVSAELFHGVDRQAHICYFGACNFFQLKNQKQIYLELEGDDSLMEVLASEEICQWEYGGKEWCALDKPILEKTSGRLILRLAVSGELEELSVHSISSRWIRCIVLKNERVTTFSRLSLKSVRAKAEFGPNDRLQLEGMFPTAGPFPFEPGPEGIYPFGKYPQTELVFYFANEEVFSKKGCEITMEFMLLSIPAEHDPDQMDDDCSIAPRVPLGFAPDAMLAWEYWNGTDWTKLPGICEHLYTDIPEGQSRQVRFICPNDIQSLNINKTNNYWLRVRIESGNYRYEKKIDDKHCEYLRIPPLLKDLSLSYTIPDSLKSVEHCVTYNNLTYRLRSEEVHTGKSFRPFDTYALPHPAFYLGFDGPLSHGPVQLFIDMESQMYSDEQLPRLEWDYYRINPNGIGQWARLDIQDDTKHLTRTGILKFASPTDLTSTLIFGQQKCWLRALDVEDRFQTTNNSSSSTKAPAPKLTGLHLNTVMAQQKETRADEVAGSSIGSTNQTFSILQPPLIEAEIYVNEWNLWMEDERKAILKDREVKAYEVNDAEGNPYEFWVKWLPVDDLGVAQANQRYYEIDGISGKIRFGDGIHGMLPPVGVNNIISRTTRGGGVIGNIPAGAINSMRTTISYVEQVYNPLPADGGADAETVEQALKRGPKWIRHRNRAVTAEDYEDLALQSNRMIARAKCLPGMNGPCLQAPGWVTVIIVPASTEARPMASLELCRQVTAYLASRAPVPSAAKERIRVVSPTYLQVTIDAVLIAQSWELLPTVEQGALYQLRAYLHPLFGGSDKSGWEFGRTPCLSDFYALLERVEGADHVASLIMTITDESGCVISASPGMDEHRVIPPDALIASGNHRISAIASNPKQE